jgi:hypothetical protein
MSERKKKQTISHRRHDNTSIENGSMKHPIESKRYLYKNISKSIESSLIQEQNGVRQLIEFKNYFMCFIFK